jgi:hypothetical protein
MYVEAEVVAEPNPVLSQFQRLNDALITTAQKQFRVVGVESDVCTFTTRAFKPIVGGDAIGIGAATYHHRSIVLRLEFHNSELSVKNITIAAKNNIHQLLDRTPDDSYFTLVRDAAMKASGVHATEKILIQVYGPDAHVSIDVEVDPHLSVEVAHEITQKVRHEIQVAWPAVRDVIVHVEPYYEGDH